MRWPLTAREHQCLAFARMEEHVAIQVCHTLVTVWMATMAPIANMNQMPAPPTHASMELSALICMPLTAVTVLKDSWDCSVNMISMSVPTILVIMEAPVLTWWASFSVHVLEEQRVPCARRT